MPLAKRAMFPSYPVDCAMPSSPSIVPADTDEFLTDPRDCHFDPKVLQCTGGNARPYLTADEVTTMQKYYASTIDPVNGQVIDSASERSNETDDVVALGLVPQERLPDARRHYPAQCLRAIYIAN
jgi:hypothetical protein